MRADTVSRFAKAATIAVASMLALGVALTAAIGFAHTKAGRPLLAVLARMSGMRTNGACALGFDGAASPAQRDAARQRFADEHRGAGHAASRPALGFTLDATTRADVMTWAESHGVTCAPRQQGADLDCEAVPDALLPAASRGAPLKSLWLNFGARGALISVVAVRRDPSAATISATFGAVARDLDEEAGAPAAADGDGSAARLSSGLLQQATVEYRFRDYYAVARATNMGDGYVLTEEYRSLPD